MSSPPAGWWHRADRVPDRVHRRARVRAGRAVDQAGGVWDALFGQDIPVRAAGLAARDTLRTEMGYPLHGQDLSLDITPVQAGAGWAVGWQKPEFWGRAALLAEKEAGPRRVLRGLSPRTAASRARTWRYCAATTRSAR